MHKGKLLKLHIRKSGLDVSEIASKTGKTERTVYSWYSNPNLKEDVFLMVGEIIGVDFDPILRDLNQVSNEPELVIPVGTTELDYYKMLFENRETELKKLKVELQSYKDQDADEVNRYLLRSFRLASHQNRALVTRLTKLSDQMTELIKIFQEKGI